MVSERLVPIPLAFIADHVVSTSTPGPSLIQEARAEHHRDVMTRGPDAELKRTGDRAKVVAGEDAKVVVHTSAGRVAEDRTCKNLRDIMIGSRVSGPTLETLAGSVARPRRG